MVQRYDKILIRDATPADAAQLCAWWNDGEIMAHAGFPNGLGSTEEAIINKIVEEKNHYRHLIFYDETPIGEMNYRTLDSENCEMGIKICDFSMQNKGLGKVILSLFIGALFSEYGFKKISLDTNLANKRAQHVYEQLGFKKLRINYDSWKDQLGTLQSSVDYELTPESFVSFI